jgi:hypothetical protein
MVSSTPLERSFREEKDVTMGESTNELSVIGVSNEDTTIRDSDRSVDCLAAVGSRKKALDKTGEENLTLLSPACKKKERGRLAKDLSHEEKFTAAARKARASRKEEEEAKEAARKVRDRGLRATCNRSLDVRRRAEEIGHDMKMDPTADIAAKAHEEIEVVMNVVEVSKNLPPQGPLGCSEQGLIDGN